MREHDRQQMFKTPLAELLEKPTTTLKAWVTNTKASLSRALKDARDKLIKTNGDIREFYKSKPP